MDNKTLILPATPFGGFSVAKKPFNQRNPRLNISSCSSCLRGEKIREISVNLWLINDLRDCKAFYICRDASTTIESSLQIRLFIQNKPNFRKVKLNVNKVLTKDYGKKDTWWNEKNKPNSKPIQTQFKANSNPIQSQYKAKTNPIQTQTIPNKPNACPPSVWRDRVKNVAMDISRHYKKLRKRCYLLFFKVPYLSERQQKELAVARFVQLFQI